MDQELAYLAGFFDGEGSVSITKSGGRYTMKVEVTQLDPVPLLVFRRRFGGSLFRKPDRRGFRSMISWVVTAGGAARMLETLLPLLVVKSTQAEIALEFRRRILAPDLDRDVELRERERLFQACRAAKQKSYDDVELPQAVPVVQDHTGKRLGWAKPKPPKKIRVKVAAPIKGTRPRGIRPSREMLAEVYRDLGVGDTARNYGVSRQTIYNWLDAYNIPRQGRTDASEARRRAAAAASWQEQS